MLASGMYLQRGGAAGACKGWRAAVRHGRLRGTRGLEAQRQQGHGAGSRLAAARRTHGRLTNPLQLRGGAGVTGRGEGVAGARAAAVLTAASGGVQDARKAARAAGPQTASGNRSHCQGGAQKAPHDERSAGGWRSCRRPSLRLAFLAAAHSRAVGPVIGRDAVPKRAAALCRQRQGEEGRSAR